MPRNPFYVVRQVYQKDGIRAVYKGCGPLVLVSHNFFYLLAFLEGWVLHLLLLGPFWEEFDHVSVP
jgi:hypothetical protein